MDKDSYYFSHDTNAKTDPKIMAMRNKYGVQGYGWYWIIVETMAEQFNYKLEKSKWIYDSLATAMACDKSKAEEFINDCIVEYELFETDNDFIWSNRLLRNMARIDEIRKKKSESGKRGAEARWGKDNSCNDNSDAMATPSQPHSDAIAKYGKAKESILKESIKKATKLMSEEPVINNEEVEESASVSCDRFVKAFNDKFVYQGFSKDNVKSLKNNILQNRIAIEKEFVAVGIFLRVVLKRMIDMDNENRIKNPVNYFFAGTFFGKDKYLWRLTKKEEESGSGYHKSLIEEHYRKHGNRDVVNLIKEN